MTFTELLDRLEQAAYGQGFAAEDATADTVAIANAVDAARAAVMEAHERLRKASAKYRCLVRSEGPPAMQFEAGAELDAALAAGEPSTALPSRGEER